LRKLTPVWDNVPIWELEKSKKHRTWHEERRRFMEIVRIKCHSWWGGGGAERE
jgi:hypothetical protein